VDADAAPLPSNDGAPIAAAPVATSSSRRLKNGELLGVSILCLG
jgi:hypothetical protein